MLHVFHISIAPIEQSSAKNFVCAVQGNLYIFLTVKNKTPFPWRGKGVLSRSPFFASYLPRRYPSFQVSTFASLLEVGCWASLGLSLRQLGIRVSVRKLSYRNSLQSVKCHDFILDSL